MSTVGGRWDLTGPPGVGRWDLTGPAGVGRWDLTGPAGVGRWDLTGPAGVSRSDLTGSTRPRRSCLRPGGQVTHAPDKLASQPGRGRVGSEPRGDGAHLG